MHTFMISISDSNFGSELLEVHTQDINAEQINILIDVLSGMLNDFKSPHHSYCAIINQTMNEINLRMCEMEGNTTFCTLTTNLQGCDMFALTNNMFNDFDRNTMDISISYWMEIVPGEKLNPSLCPYVQLVNNKQLFSFEITSDVPPNWNTVLTSLSISTH